ncbi:hypothetical protein Salat_0668000 [Sesamum alatum]|uniref:Retroviral polymerase SH3-like domain-containing protein n=1 Tax=Sesamum alatum TaxID=300844 RepID=A0AAE2CUL3_9LAMI|nr:hypothetical protein Salat_0668000 [Sesamum alatum]
MNQSNTKRVHAKTPQEPWSGHKPTITHLRVFGSIAYTHVPDQKRTKLDDKSASYVFIGYDQSSKGYKLYNPSNEKIGISHDVEFDEEGVWEWNDQNKNDHYSPFFDDEEGHMAQPVTPPSTPLPQNIQADEASSSEGPREFRGLRELYDVTKEVTNLSGFTQFCLFAKTEPLDFDDAAGKSGRGRGRAGQRVGLRGRGGAVTEFAVGGRQRRDAVGSSVGLVLGEKMMKKIK